MIHQDNPFVDDPDSRDPVRRFRGRLSAPVTVFTAGAADRRTGLTVSSLIVIEGAPGRLSAVVGPSTTLWETMASTGRFVVHICDEGHRGLAQVFAGLRPAPGGMFSGLDVSDSDWGPVIADLGDRAYCTYESAEEIGYSGVVAARIDKVEIEDLTRPLSYFRGRFRDLQ